MTSEKASHEPLLIPLPAEMAVKKGGFEFTPKTVIIYTSSSSETIARTLATPLRPATGFLLPVQSKKSQHSNVIVFETSQDDTLDNEEYTLITTSSQVTITAKTAAGFFYGAQTLRQLMPPEIFSTSPIHADWKIPCVSIRDFPRFSWRGMHLDVSRHFMPKTDVLRFIDTIASLKFNRFHWHLTDDQGWRIEIKKYPKLTETGAYRKETLTGH